jgi:hypothetical protein
VRNDYSLIFNEFFREYNQLHIQLSQEEWRLVDYLLSITQPFFIFTNVVSKSRDITIHTVFGIYNTLFNHIEKSKTRLARKKVRWKTVMLKVLAYAKDKLSEYCSATDTIGDDLYAIGTIIAPQNKLEFLQTSEWESEWHIRYSTARVSNSTLSLTKNDIRIHGQALTVSPRQRRSQT